MLGLLDPVSEVVVVGEEAGGAVTVTVLGPSALELDTPQDLCAVDVNCDSAQPCCVIVVLG